MVVAAAGYPCSASADATKRRWSREVAALRELRLLVADVRGY